MSMPNDKNYDLLVIGAGPGGYVAAIRAAQLGKKVAVVEKNRVGGVCLNIGCIPTKAIIHRAEIFRDRAKLAAMGVRVDDSGFRYEAVFDESRKTAEALSKGVSYLLKKNGVDVITGAARITGNHEVAVNNNDGSERKISAAAIIIAAGSRPKAIPGLEFDGERILSSDDALTLKSLPRAALIVGGGAIGVEFAHIFNAFGVEVSVVEMADRILPAADGEITAVLTRSFMKRGIKIHTSSKVSSYNIDGGAINAVIEDRDGKKTEASVDKIFVMTGRAPNGAGIGAEELGISVTNGFISVGDYYQTSVPSVYAIGDVAMSKPPLPMLAHAASAEGEIAAEHIAGHLSAARIDPLSVPAVVYSDPQVASFGLTEESALSQNVPFVKAAFPFKACGKAAAVESTEGMVKIIAAPSTKKILGAHIIGPDASELIHELLLARDAGIGVSDVAAAIHAHPTLSESIMEAARAVEGRAVHV